MLDHRSRSPRGCCHTLRGPVSTAAQNRQRQTCSRMGTGGLAGSERGLRQNDESLREKEQRNRLVKHKGWDLTKCGHFEPRSSSGKDRSSN
eukprot:3940699-Rhodomonas_salina.1